MEDYKERTWTDKKGRTVYLFQMSTRWLINIRRVIHKHHPKREWIVEEIKRRHELRKSKGA